jgi:predicted RNA-binding protein with PIN domain
VTLDEPVVLVDARNVMRSRWPNIRAARFVDLVHAWAEREGVTPVIVFDGPAPRERPSGVELHGTYGETADDWIAREAERLFDERHRVWLVTSDRGLRRRSEPYVERTIGGGTFATELEAVERSLRSTPEI